MESRHSDAEDSLRTSVCTTRDAARNRRNSYQLSWHINDGSKTYFHSSRKQIRECKPSKCRCGKRIRSNGKSDPLNYFSDYFPQKITILEKFRILISILQ